MELFFFYLQLVLGSGSESLLLDDIDNHNIDIIDDTIIQTDWSASIQAINSRLTAMEQNMQQNTQMLQNLVESSAKMENMMQFLMKHVKIDSESVKGESGGTATHVSSNVGPLKDDGFGREFKQMDSIEDIQNFENLMETNEKYVQRALEYFKCAIGSSLGTGTGKTAAFALVDLMFTRQFFLKFSWTGIGSSRAEKKVALQQFGLTLDFFWKIITNADSSFDKSANRSFFQDVMNRAKKRVEEADQLPKRRSTKKNRPKVGNYKKWKTEEVDNTSGTESNLSNKESKAMVDTLGETSNNEQKALVEVTNDSEQLMKDFNSLINNAAENVQ